MTYRGRTVVLGIYGFLVALAAGFGYVLGAVILPARLDGPLPTAQFGPLSFPITPYTLAAYGAVTVALGCGVALLAVAYVSRRFTDDGTEAGRPSD